jgi:hypothetical protein
LHGVSASRKIDDHRGVRKPSDITKLTAARRDGTEAATVRTRKLLLSALALALLAATSPSSPSVACGYHDDVALARGMLNWVYPDALHVIGAISTAVTARRLPPPNSGTATTDLLGSRYRTTAKSLERFAQALYAASERPPPLSFSLVLVEPMLWTRFEAGQGEVRTQVHVSGPQSEDLVLISGEDVIRELANGGLTIGEAREVGLIRFYGSERHIMRFLDAYKDVGSKGPHAKHDALEPQEDSHDH